MAFSEILVIVLIALLVLGPERLPKLARDVGHFIGRARAMARQFTDQLEREVRLEETNRAQSQTIIPPSVSTHHTTSAASTPPTPSTPVDSPSTHSPMPNAAPIPPMTPASHTVDSPTQHVDKSAHP